MNNKNNIIIPAGTEVRASEIGYYEFWYPSKTGQLLTEDTPAEIATASSHRCSTTGDWMPVIVSKYVASNYGSPVKILWIRKKNKNS